MSAARKTPTAATKGRTHAPVPQFFTSSAALRDWLAANHDRVRELWIGIYKKASGKGGITYPEALDQALCYGWIDGVRKRYDEESFVQRFTPRLPKSNWSTINRTRVAALTAAGLMAPPGLAAFTTAHAAAPRRRAAATPPTPPAPPRPDPPPRPQQFDAAREAAFKAHAPAWSFFRAQPPGYQRLCTRYVMEAAKDETRDRRLQVVLAHSSHERRLNFLAPDLTLTVAPATARAASASPRTNAAASKTAARRPSKPRR